MPRLVIAGTHSGVGKTSLSVALVAALKRRGLKVQTFKVGPDFLDPTYLAMASGRTCYNLDGWMSGKEYVIELFHRTTRDVDIAVIEGVMGLFDGADPATSEGSSAEIARWLDAPVLLIVSVYGLARSLAAVVKGYVEFESGLRISGIIANHAGSDNHKNWLIQSLRSSSLPPLLGAIPRQAFATLPRRHLGLFTADGQNLSPKVLQEMADVLEKHLSLDAILKIARSASFLPSAKPLLNIEANSKRVTLGIAHDRAFHFYYPDNLDKLKLRGCDLIRFSPLEDEDLPEGLDGLYLGGGYPEEYAETLANNHEMQEAVQRFALRGLPIYAECGGLMYLTQGIETLDGKKYPMVGLLPAWSRMLDRLKSLGYVEITLKANTLWGDRGAVFRGHEFHYSELIGNPSSDSLWTSVYTLKRRHSNTTAMEGFQRGKILASYVHLHWASRPEAIENLVTHCREKP